MSIDDIRTEIRREASRLGLLSAHDIAGLLSTISSYAPAELEKAVDHIDDAITECEREIGHERALAYEAAAEEVAQKRGVL